jgi:hypothetical protein
MLPGTLLSGGTAWKQWGELDIDRIRGLVEFPAFNMGSSAQGSPESVGGHNHGTHKRNFPFFLRCVTREVTRSFLFEGIKCIFRVENISVMI